MPLQQEFQSYLTDTLLPDYPHLRSAVTARLDFLCLSRMSSFDPEWAFSSSGALSGRHCNDYFVPVLELSSAPLRDVCALASNTAPLLTGLQPCTLSR